MKKIVLAFMLAAGCGANTVAVEHAEEACMVEDYAAAKAKLATIAADPEASAKELTMQEMKCALEALDAKASAK